jgi:hypothetical protein
MWLFAGQSLPARTNVWRLIGCQMGINRLSYFVQKENKNDQLIAVAFALALATSAQAATPLPPLHQPNGMITQVRHNCGAGMRWNEALGRCATTSARRHVRRGVITGGY